MSLEETLEDYKTYPIRAIAHRGLTKETCEKYGVRVSLSPHDGETILSHKYPYYRKDKLTGFKERIVEGKIIYSKGDCKDAQLFGSHCCPANGKTLFITEGELDCLSLYQVLKSLSNLPGWEPAVVSLSHGAASAARDLSNDFDYVNSFDKIVLVFDQDDAGQAAVDDACKILAGKVYIARLSEKDPNDMLLKGKAEEMKWEVLKHARQYMPDNIVNYADMWDRYKNSRNQTCYQFPDAWPELNNKTYGVRLGELVMITSGSGMGKTQFMRELKNHYHETTDFKFADIALEEDVGDTIAGLVSLKLNKRITLPDVTVSPEEEQAAFDYYFESRRWTGYDFFGGLDDDNLFSKIRFFAATGHKFIFLDHLSIIVSEFAAEGGERERIDTIMTKLAKLVKELNITIFLIVHLKKTSQGTSFEEGATPSLDDLRGSGTLKQLSMTVIALSRNQQHDDPFCANTSKITVLKCRFTGRTGTSDFLHFNDRTGRMVPVPCPPNYEADKKNQGGRAQITGSY
jgi:twinkle protein